MPPAPNRGHKAWERVGRGKLLLRCPLLGGARRFGAHGGGEGRGHIVTGACLQLVVSEMLVQRCNAVLLHVSLSAPDYTDW